MAIVVDTNIFIDLLEGHDGAKEFFKKHMHEISFSAITEAEILSGSECKDGDVHERILHLLSRFEKIPVDNPLVQAAALFRRTHKIALPDAIIAASATAKDGILATRNTKDFKKLPITVITPY